MPVAVTPIYAALLALLFLWLSAQVIRYRRARGLSLGDEGDRGLLKRMRAQANCAEYAPIGILLLLLAELQGTPSLALHALGLSLLVGRALHGYGFPASPPIFAFRFWGMVLTLAMIVITAVVVLAQAMF